jgi:hypothetical protein
MAQAASTEVCGRTQTSRANWSGAVATPGAWNSPRESTTTQPRWPVESITAAARATAPAPGSSVSHSTSVPGTAEESRSRRSNGRSHGLTGGGEASGAAEPRNLSASCRSTAGRSAGGQAVSMGLMHQRQICSKVHYIDTNVPTTVQVQVGLPHRELRAYPNTAVELARDGDSRRGSSRTCMEAC